MEKSEQGVIVPVRTDVEPKTLEIFEGIRSGTVTAEDLQDLIDRDPLIENFINTRGFERRLENYLKSGVRGVLIAVDVDDFKRFNDSQGHPAGDELLKKAAEILRNQTRVNPQTEEPQEQRHERNEELDLLARAGGDEFLIFLVDIDMPDAIKAAKRIRHAITRVVRQDFPEYGPDQTMSLGLSAVQDADNVLWLRQRADKALYLAKGGKESKVPEDAIAIY